MQPLFFIQSTLYVRTNHADKRRLQMKRLSHWLHLKGTPFSLARRADVAIERQNARPRDLADVADAAGVADTKQGMSTRQPRLETAPAMESATDASNDTSTTLADAFPFVENATSGVYAVEPPVSFATPTPFDAYAPTAPLTRLERRRSKRTDSPGEKKAREPMSPILENVTLVVYGWQNVEPGTLSWVFPSVSAAVAAARAMRNAVKWAIVAGKRETVDLDETETKDTLEEMRADGAVLIEEAG